MNKFSSKIFDIDEVLVMGVQRCAEYCSIWYAAHIKRAMKKKLTLRAPISIFSLSYHPLSVMKSRESVAVQLFWFVTASGWQSLVLLT